GDHPPKVTRRQPGGEVPRFERTWNRRADPDAGDPKAELVVVEAAQRFAEHLAHRVVRVRPHRVRRPDSLRGGIETRYVVRRREDDAIAAFEPGCFEKRPGALDVGM